MSAKFTLNKAINDLANALDNDFVMQHIVARLIDKINRSKIVKAKSKIAITSYFKPYIQEGKLIEYYGTTSGNNILNILIIAVIYYLSDLNIYDYHLINYSFEFGLEANDIMVLLLLNNIYDINTFCQLRSISGDKYHTISTLKKLSALHKIQYNF